MLRALVVLVCLAGDDATLTVVAPAKDAAKLKALGLISALTLGARPPMRDLMIAKGESPRS